MILLYKLIILNHTVSENFLTKIEKSFREHLEVFLKVFHMLYFSEGNALVLCDLLYALYGELTIDM